MNLEKAFNVREGATRKDDHLPHRLMNEVLPPPSGKGDDRSAAVAGRPDAVKEQINSRAHLDRMLDEYYELHGWDKATGFQRCKTLGDLDLGDVAAELDRMGKLAKD